MKALLVLAAVCVSFGVATVASADPQTPWVTGLQLARDIKKYGVKFASDGGPRVVTRARCTGTGAVRYDNAGNARYRKFVCAYQLANGAIWICNARTSWSGFLDWKLTGCERTQDAFLRPAASG